MKAALEQWLHRRWYGDVAPGLGLRALAGLYRVLSTRDATVPERLPAPVIVVGNFTAGGTGKTPLVIALARYFHSRGRRPGILSRGHGRASTAPVRVTAGMPAAECGDEPLLMFESTGLPVWVDRDRVAAAHAAIDAGCDLLISDDGLQHARLSREVEIEVVDGARRYGNGLLLPAGPLREAPRRCDFRVVNGEGAAEGEWAMRLRLGDAVAIAAQQDGDAAPLRVTRALADFAPGPVHAIAGIGNPDRFFDALEGAGIATLRHPFADHHAFRAEDFRGLDGPVLMTGKDAVKCRRFGLADAWSVPVEAELEPRFFTAVEAALAATHARD